MKRLLLALWMLAFLLSTSASAVKVSSLYEADSAVPSQTDDLKEQAIRDGFFQVLVKLSGDPQIDKNADIKSELSRADYYVQDLAYSPSTTSSAEYLLKIHYSPGDVDRLLKRNGILFWGENRPLILVWLTVTNLKNETQIINNDASNDSLIKEQSKKFGLPFIFPILDMDEMNQVSAADVMHINLPVLNAASKRYAPDALLVGHIEITKDKTHSDWELILKANKWNWAIESKVPENIMTALMNQISQTLSKQYITKAKEAPPIWLTLEVNNISQGDDLNQLMAYLKKITLVDDVQLSQVAGDVVDISVLVRGSLADLQQNVDINQRMVLKTADNANHKLIYEWR